MKLKLSVSNNTLNVQLVDTADEPISTYRADSISFELDVAKLIGSIEELMQMFSNGLEKTTEPTPTASKEA